MDINPLNNLSSEVRQALVVAGWTPGKTRKRAKKRFVEHPIATKVLDEVEGIEVAPLHQTGPYRPLRICFKQDIAEGYEDEINEVGKRLHVTLSPLGNVGNGVAILLLADTGHVLLMGYADKGVLLAGASLGEGLWRTLTGERNQAIHFDDDPNKKFWNDDISPDDPSTYHPGPEGLRVKNSGNSSNP